MHECTSLSHFHTFTFSLNCAHLLACALARGRHVQNRLSLWVGEGTRSASVAVLASTLRRETAFHGDGDQRASRTLSVSVSMTVYCAPTATSHAASNVVLPGRHNSRRPVMPWANSMRLASNSGNLHASIRTSPIPVVHRRFSMRLDSPNPRNAARPGRSRDFGSDLAAHSQGKVVCCAAHARSKVYPPWAGSSSFAKASAFIPVPSTVATIPMGAHRQASRL